MMHIKEQLSQLNKTSKKSVALYHKVADFIGVSDSLLGVLYALSDTEEPKSQYDLSNEWFIPKQTTNSAVAALQRNGFVTLSQIDGAKNKKKITLTDTGKLFVEKNIAVLRRAESDALAELTFEERELYVRLNQKYNQYLSIRLDSLLGSSE